MCGEDGQGLALALIGVLNSHIPCRHTERCAREQEGKNERRRADRQRKTIQGFVSAQA